VKHWFNKLQSQNKHYCQQALWRPVEISKVKEPTAICSCSHTGECWRGTHTFHVYNLILSLRSGSLNILSSRLELSSVCVCVCVCVEARCR